MFVITTYFESPKEDWYCQLGHPRKIKNLLTYLLTKMVEIIQCPLFFARICVSVAHGV